MWFSFSWMARCNLATPHSSSQTPESVQHFRCQLKRCKAPISDSKIKKREIEDCNPYREPVSRSTLRIPVDRGLCPAMQSPSFILLRSYALTSNLSSFSLDRTCNDSYNPHLQQHIVSSNFPSLLLRRPPPRPSPEPL